MLPYMYRILVKFGDQKLEEMRVAIRNINVYWSVFIFYYYDIKFKLVFVVMAC